MLESEVVIKQEKSSPQQPYDVQTISAADNDSNIHLTESQQSNVQESQMTVNAMQYSVSAMQIDANLQANIQRFEGIALGASIGGVTGTRIQVKEEIKNKDDP